MIDEKLFSVGEEPCGSNSVVECYLPKVNVEGSIPFCRSFVSLFRIESSGTWQWLSGQFSAISIPTFLADSLFPILAFFILFEIIAFTNSWETVVFLSVIFPFSNTTLVLCHFQQEPPGGVFTLVTLEHIN
jgi:hypothetical protein